MPQGPDNKSRAIKPLILVSLITALVALAVVGLFFYVQVSTMAMQEARQHTKNASDIFTSQTMAFLEERSRSSSLLSQEPEILRLFTSTGQNVLDAANATLDRYCSILEASACYLMDSTGLTVSSSNRNTKGSFVGKNYGFRPYFKNAIQGNPAVYLALGVTSKKRGLYFSAPVASETDKPLGVAIIKFSPEPLERKFSQASGIIAFTDTHGIVFASNKPEWLYKSLWSLSPEQTSAIENTLQFGDQKLDGIGLTLNEEHLATSLDSINFLHQSRPLTLLPGWRIHYLFNTDNIRPDITRRHRRLGYIMTVLFVLFSAGAFFLYSRANREIKKNQAYERALEHSEDRFRRLSEISNEAIFIHDRGIPIDVNSYAEQMFGYNRGELLSLTAQDFFDPEYLDLVMQNITEENVDPYEAVAVTKTGEKFPVEITGRMTYWKDHKVRVTVLRDISLRKEQEERIIYQAHYDALTGLPNRMLFKDRVNQAIKSARRNKSLLGLLFIDLDNFKIINDTMGHDHGDVLLQQAAQRLNATLRENDTVGRHGGDEFVILLSELRSPLDAEIIVENIIQAFEKPFNVNDKEFIVGMSIGVTIYPDDGKDYQALLKNADIAMYKSKEEGKNTFRFYADTMNEEAYRQLEVEHRLHKALENNEFYLVYQPICDARTMRIKGAEALLRWNNPDLGLVPPDEFIPLAEKTGGMIKIGEWVLRSACTQAAHWQNHTTDLFKISVNLSPRQIRDPAFIDLLKNILADSGLHPAYLQLEITEGLLVEQSPSTHDMLDAIHNLGVSIAMDDFGTGFSSLSYLRNFPFDALKIDRSFIHDLDSSPEAQVLIKATIAMAEGLGLDVVAEGIENDQQLEFLVEKDCDLVQGYLLGRPVDAEVFYQSYLD